MIVTVAVPLPTTCNRPTPPSTVVSTVSVPCSTDNSSSMSSPPASTSAIEMPASAVSLSCSTATGPAGNRFTGASLTAFTVIETVSVLELSGPSQGAAEQLSGSPRSVTL